VLENRPIACDFDANTLPLADSEGDSSLPEEWTLPLEDLQACRQDRELQAGRHRPAEIVGRARHCPNCGAAPEDLVWFSSPEWTWPALCGCAGWVSFCDRDSRQVEFFEFMRS
jgi:hypothetical protein